MTNLDTNHFDLMEVDLSDLQPISRFDSKVIDLPNLASLMQPSEGQSPIGLSLTPRSSEQDRRLITFFKTEPVDIPPHHHLEARRQQIHQPTCPEEVSASFEGSDKGVNAPSIEWCETIDDIFLSEEDVAKELATLAPVTPSMPDLCDAPAKTTRLCIVLPPASVPKHQRRDTISLRPPTEREAHTPTGSSCASQFDAHNREFIHDEMAYADDDADERSPGQCSHIPEPANRATSSELRKYDNLAHCISEMHLAMTQYHELTHAKKKPMLHEFLGYILFSQGPALEELRKSVYFCCENGDVLPPGRVGRYFRVANFPNISEVWRKIKCNSSQDCTKNMKRAMRMSTTNDRRYFDSLSQKSHRRQVFMFGERSMEHFQKLFPH